VVSPADWDAAFPFHKWRFTDPDWVWPEGFEPRNPDDQVERTKRGSGKSNSKVPHIPRPPNCFIIFRCKLMPYLKFLRLTCRPWTEEEDRIMAIMCAGDGTKDSKAAASAWRELHPLEKKIYVGVGKMVKKNHQVKFPGYRFQPDVRKGKEKKMLTELRRKKVLDKEEMRNEPGPVVSLQPSGMSSIS
jgi:hypothetical protein